MLFDVISGLKRLFFYLGFGVVLGAFCVLPAQAQFSKDADAPIDITAKKFESFPDKDYGIWTGDVQVIQGEVLLTAPSLVIYGIAAGEANRIEATGGMRYTNGLEAITGDAATYDAASETITVTGSVVVVQGDQVMTGGALVYNTKTGEMQFASNASSLSLIHI